MRWFLGAISATLVACGAGATNETPTVLPMGEPFAVSVFSYDPGEGAGFGQDLLPDIVLGPPEGGGQAAGSTDVLSLGAGGEIVLELGRAVLDGEGVDFLVFENAFAYGTDPDAIWVELGEVSVSEDAEDWYTFVCSAEGYPWTNCAGATPTLSNTENGVDPGDPSVAGGDGFDLQAVDLDVVWYVRIRDLSDSGIAPSGGFDLDAISVVTTGR